MYKIIFALFLILPFTSSAQDAKLPIDSATLKITFQSVEQLPGVSKDELYVRAKEWFVRTFRSAQKVIQMDDKQAGKIIGNGTARGYKSVVLSGYSFTVFYTVSITVKDGRYRFEISDFERELESGTVLGSGVRESVDALIQNPKNRKSDGEYKGSLKDVSIVANTVGRDLSQSIVESMSKSNTGFKSKDDF